MSIKGRAAVEREIMDAVSGGRLWQDTQFLGSRYRESGSEAERVSVDYIVDELKKHDIDVKVFELTAYLSYHRAAELEIVAPESARRSILAVARAFTESTPPEGIEVEVVLSDEYEGEVSDKAVLTARDWAGGNRAHQGRVQIHTQTTHEANLHRTGTTPVWGTPTTQNAHLIKPECTGVIISRPDGDALRELVQQGPVRVRVRTKVDTGWRRIRFPVASIPGRAPTFVLAGGHLDSHDPGVTDNATGCASLLEIARLFKAHQSDLKHGLRIGWWTGHESAGYAGSTFFCDNEWENIHDNGVFFLTIDGSGIRGATSIEGRYVFPQAEGFVLDLIREYFGRDPDIVAKPIKMGDQSFWGTGMPSGTVYRCVSHEHPDWAVVFGAGNGKWWHSTDDTFDKVDRDILVDDTKFYALALFRLCTAELLPFEFVTYAGWMKEILQDIQSEVGSRLDLSVLIERVNEFELLARQLQETTTAAANDGAARHAELNGLMMRLSRYLNPVFFTLVGLYDQDLRGAIPGPAVRYPLPHEPRFEPRYFPGLQRARPLAKLDPASPEYAILYSTSLRERNRVAHALRQANEDLRRTLGAR